MLLKIVTTGVVALTVLSTAAAPVAAAAAPSPVQVNVVAHQDDDILFMTPDLENAIRAGRSVKTIFLTAGEGELEHVDTESPDDEDLPDRSACEDVVFDDMAREEYAYCRQQGAHDAWAAMAGIAPSQAVWERRLLNFTAAGRTYRVQEHTLAQSQGRLQLVFVNLPEWGDRHPDVQDCDGHPDPGQGCLGANLYHLWANERGTRNIAPWGSGLTAAEQVYDDRRSAVELLRSLFTHYRPTIIRTQDPEPDTRYRAEPSAWAHDHSDHIIGARLATEAAGLYGGPDGRDVVRLLPYRNYNTSDGQVNLTAAQRTRKLQVFTDYAAWDAGASPAGDYEAWVQRSYHRYDTGTTWVGRNQDGRLQAFAVQSGRLVTWWQAPGGEFPAPKVLPLPGPLAPGVSVTSNQSGRLQVFARRLDTNEIVTTWQDAINGEFPGWESLGNPNAGTGGAAQVGTPVAVTAPDGLIRVFVKNGGGGVSARVQRLPDQGFEPNWLDLPGVVAGVQDGLAAGVDRSGGVDVFAYSVDGGVGTVKHWSAPYDPIHGMRGFVHRGHLPATGPGGFEPAGPPSVARSADGRMDVFYRLATNSSGDRAGLVGHSWQNPDGSWTTVSEHIGGHGGIGEVAAAGAPGTWTGSDAVEKSLVRVFATNGGGGLSTTGQQAPDAGYSPSWTDLGGFQVGQPAAGVDRRGNVFVFTLTDSGSLEVRNQTSPGGTPLTRHRVLEAP